MILLLRQGCLCSPRYPGYHHPSSSSVLRSQLCTTVPILRIFLLEHKVGTVRKALTASKPEVRDEPVSALIPGNALEWYGDWLLWVLNMTC